MSLWSKLVGWFSTQREIARSPRSDEWFWAPTGDQLPVRPRFGRVRYRDGTSEPLVFVPTDEPGAFEGRLASTEEKVYAERVAALEVDVLGPGQSVYFHVSGTYTDGSLPHLPLLIVNDDEVVPIAGWVDEDDTP
jgi:hypothetical protein